MGDCTNTRWHQLGLQIEFADQGATIVGGGQDLSVVSSNENKRDATQGQVVGHGEAFFRSEVDIQASEIDALPRQAPKCFSYCACHHDEIGTVFDQEAFYFFSKKVAVLNDQNR